MKAKGVKFLDPRPIEEGWGFSAGLVDSEGNDFAIYETPQSVSFLGLGEDRQENVEYQPPSVKLMALRSTERSVGLSGKDEFA